MEKLPLADGPRYLREFFAFITAARHWSRLHPELAADADLRRLLAAYPDPPDVADDHQRVEDVRRGIVDRYERQFRVFDATLSAITDFVYAFDRDGRFLYVNRPLLDLWGLELEAAVGKNFFDLHYPDDLAAKLQRQIQQVIETRSRVSDETPYTSPTGGTGYYEYIFSPVFGADGMVEAVAGSTRDITGRRRRELNLEFLAEMQQLLASLSSSAEIMQLAGERVAARLQLTHCLLVEINETADEATVLSDHHAPDAASHEGSYRIADFHTDFERREMAAGRPVAIHDVRLDPRSEANAARFAQLGIAALANASYAANGRWKFILSAQKSEPYAWPQEDVELLSELAARIYPRLERARAEESLRESEERYRRTFENAAIGIAHVGLDGRWLRANQAISDITGYPFAELATRTFADITHPDDLEADLVQVRRTLAGEIPTYSMEKRYVRRDGSPVWVNLTVSLLRDAAGHPLHFIAAVEDITERRRIEVALQAAKEAAEAANSSKDRFLAVLSHELRTPLTPALMTAAALRADETLPPEVREQIEMIERNVTLEARLIDDLLDLTRIANGKLALRTQPCDAHSLLGLVVEMVRSDALEKRHTIDFELSARRSQLTGDPARLQQVFWNLLRNAVKFTPAGGRILVRTCDRAGTAGEEPEARLCIEVTDNGIGFEPGAAGRIFQPFEQTTSGHHFGGLGLGLAIARAIVDMHGGTIHATSPGPGQGATFTVDLPGLLSSRAEADPSFGSGHSRPGDPRVQDAPLRLLVVEDHDPTRQVLTRLLARAGHRITMAGSLAEARAAAAGDRFDLVISDLGLPDGTGLELMSDLRAAHGLRGIALSGYGTDEDLRRSQDAGFVAHLVKPVDINELRRVLSSIPMPGHG